MDLFCSMFGIAACRSLCWILSHSRASSGWSNRSLRLASRRCAGEYRGFRRHMDRTTVWKLVRRSRRITSKIGGKKPLVDGFPDL
jgi:hypothetical protein